MFGSVGMPELILIFIVALLVFGPKKLPEIGKSLGKGLAEFKRASDELKKTIENEIEQGKNEVSTVRDHLASVPESLRSAPPLEDPAPPPRGEAATVPAPAPPIGTEPALTEGLAVGSTKPIETTPQPESRPIEPS